MTEAFTLRVAGKPFHCEKCGSNCFHRYTNDPNKYECNGCGVSYSGEPTVVTEPALESIERER